MDFAVGANQGQGVPADPGTEGLAVHLVGCAHLPVVGVDSVLMIVATGIFQCHCCSRGDVQWDSPAICTAV